MSKNGSERDGRWHLHVVRPEPHIGSHSSRENERYQGGLVRKPLGRKLSSIRVITHSGSSALANCSSQEGRTSGIIAGWLFRRHRILETSSSFASAHGIAWRRDLLEPSGHLLPLVRDSFRNTIHYDHLLQVVAILHSFHLL